jgi:hypothetical protein
MSTNHNTTPDASTLAAELTSALEATQTGMHGAMIYVRQPDGTARAARMKQGDDTDYQSLPFLLSLCGEQMRESCVSMARLLSWLASNRRGDTFILTAICAFREVPNPLKEHGRIPDLHVQAMAQNPDNGVFWQWIEAEGRAVPVDGAAVASRVNQAGRRASGLVLPN